MKLELGKTYITKNGREMTVLDLNFDNSDAPILCKGKNEYGYMATYFFDVHGISHWCSEFNIVKEKPNTVKVYVLRHKATGMFETDYYNHTVTNVKDAYLFSESEVNNRADWGNEREFILIGEIECDL